MLFRIDMVNKKQFEQSEDFKEIKIVIPREYEKLKEDFRYLELDYDNYTIQDTHIIECNVVYKEDKNFAEQLTNQINDLIIRASIDGYTTPFKEIKNFYDTIKKFDKEDRIKLLAILEGEKEDICTIYDAITYAKNINCFELIEADDKEELARYLVHNGEIDYEDLIDYTDLAKLGRDYANDKAMKKTEQGFLSQNRELSYNREQEEEEEME